MTANSMPSFDAGLDIPRRSDAGPAPLSFAQELLWLMDHASPGLTAWNAPRAVRLRGALDIPALQQALDGLVARHEVLRTVFTGPESAPRQVVQPAGPVHLERVDLTAEAPDQREATLDRLVREHARAHFDLSRDPMLRAQLITLGGAEHVLCLNSHHIVFDGWSRSLMLRELSALYDAAHRGVPAALEALPIQYGDYASWERSAEHGATIADSLAYWRQQLAGALPSLDLPTDRPRPQSRSFDGDRRVMVLPPALVEAVARLAREQNVTPYMALLATYVTLLHRYTGQDEIVIGSPIAGRLQSETEGLIGFFANTLVLRCHVGPRQTFSDLLTQVRDTALGAYEHQEVPFERLVLELQKDRQLSHAPLFQAVLTMEDTVPASLLFDGVDVDTLGVELGAAKFDLTLLVGQQPDGLRLSLWYRSDLHEAETVERMLRHFRAILEDAVRNPGAAIGDLRMLSADDERAILAQSTGPLADPPTVTVSARIAAVAARTPNATAVRCGDVTLTYGALDLRANQVANRLHALGVMRGDAVGICIDRSADAIAAIVGIMKSGAAYVPLAPELPTARLTQQITEAAIRVVVTNEAHRDRLPASVAMLMLDVGAPDNGDRAMADASSLDDVAYVLFTSGSTGTPKGVAVTHRNLAHYTSAIGTCLGLTDVHTLHFATVSTLAADLGNTAIFPALAGGGTLHVITPDVATDAARFGDYVAAHPIDVLKITPNHVRALLSGPRGDAVLPRRWLVLGGEACTWELADQVLRTRTCRLLNHYGPTETTVGCCTFEVTSESARTARDRGALSVPIGRPLPNTAAYIVDVSGGLVAPGVAGELIVGGAGVTKGYVHRVELTAERFNADRFSTNREARVYHTGDRVRRIGMGEIEFLGRIDDQVKVRGYRVEPGEIAQVLMAHPGVAQAAVLASNAGAPASDTMLVAYVVAKTAGYAAAHAERPTAERLMAFAAERLPEYMIPAHVILLDALPLGANGKLDRTALPAPDAAAGADGYVAPQTTNEIAVAQIWREVLKRERVGASDNFLSLGGHSLLAIRVLGRISKQLGVRLPLRTLFEAPTVTALAAIIDADQQAREAALLQALSDIEQLSDADVSRKLAGERPSGTGS